MIDLDQITRMALLGCLLLGVAFATPLFFIHNEKGGIRFRSVWTLALMVILIVMLVFAGTAFIISSWHLAGA